MRLLSLLWKGWFLVNEPVRSTLSSYTKVSKSGIPPSSFRCKLLLLLLWSKGESCGVAPGTIFPVEKTGANS